MAPPLLPWFRDGVPSERKAMTVNEADLWTAVDTSAKSVEQTRAGVALTGQSLRPGAKMIQIVATTASGDGRALAMAQRINDAIQLEGWATRLQSFDDLKDLARWSAACRPAFSHLVCIGGDSTMSACALAAVRHG